MGRDGTRLAMNCLLWRLGGGYVRALYTILSALVYVWNVWSKKKLKVIKLTQFQSPPLTAVLDSSHMAWDLLLTPDGWPHPFCVWALLCRCPGPLFTSSLRVGHLLRVVHTAPLPIWGCSAPEREKLPPPVMPKSYSMAGTTPGIFTDVVSGYFSSYSPRM